MRTLDGVGSVLIGYEKWMGYVLLSEGMMVYLEGVEILDEVVHVVVRASVLRPTVGVCWN